MNDPRESPELRAWIRERQAKNLPYKYHPKGEYGVAYWTIRTICKILNMLFFWTSWRFAWIAR